MSDKINSIKHKHQTRAHIPSKEEAGYETANETVNEGSSFLEMKKNPIVHRGQDPELNWMNKYGNDDREELLKIDIRSLYRHEHIAPEQLIKGLYRIIEQKPKAIQGDLFSSVNELFGNALEHDELDKISEYYQHSDGWTNRMIQGDSLLVMASLLEREGMAGQVQTIYIDPPYGIKYNSNWQIKVNDRNVKDGKDEHVSGEPEMIKAFRDTWEDGIHSYLSYLRDRLLIAKELLHDSGSCFVQISDENVHLVRNIMDEVFGSENYIGMIYFRKTTVQSGNLLPSTNDIILWYSKSYENVKFRKLYWERKGIRWVNYDYLKLKNGEFRKMTLEERKNPNLIPLEAKIYRRSPLTSPDKNESTSVPFEYMGKNYTPGNGHWKTSLKGLKRLAELNRLEAYGKTLSYRRFLNDFPYYPMSETWTDTASGGYGDKKNYVVQTNRKVIQRCILMTTDPGDLVLDPTCGSGTTAYVAEQWGRRWLTIDTSRIALNIAKTRLLTATFPYYHLYSDVHVQTTHKDGKIKKAIKEKHDTEKVGDIRQGFVYEEVPHITLKSLANDEPPATEILYDKPRTDTKKLRVAGPFTVETLQNEEPVSPDNLDDDSSPSAEDSTFEERIFEHLKSAGIKNGIKNEQAVFIRVENLADSYLHAEGFYLNAAGLEQKAYFHIGPKFGTVSRQGANKAIKACRQRGDADWLIILGFTFESDIKNANITMSVGSFEVTKVRMHDDLMQDGLLKKDKKAASFVTIGEPDIRLHHTGSQAHVEICGLDIYDPIRDIVKARNVEDIAYWMVDEDYDGSNFIVTQIFFCGGKKDEFKKWRRGLDSLAKRKSRRKVESQLKIEIDEEAFDRLYGFESHPFEVKQGQKIAVRVISQFGEESMKVLSV